VSLDSVRETGDVPLLDEEARDLVSNDLGDASVP